MTEKPVEPSHIVSIGGIKFSQELVHVRIAPSTTQDSFFTELLQLIAEKHINIPFISHATRSSSDYVSFCIDSEDFDQVQEILNSADFHHSPAQITKGVGTLTIFPHRNSFFLLGSVVSLFGKYQFPLYSLGTSISAIACNTDFKQLDQIVEKLATIIQLPKNHAPFRQEFCLKQID